MSIKSIDALVTSRCNLACPFCYGPNNMEDLPFSFWKYVLEEYKTKGVEAVVFSGGEPTLRFDIKEIIYYAKNLGYKTVLSTNGILKKKILECLDNIDWLALPLDSMLENTNKKLRTCYNHYNIVTDLVSEVRKYFPLVKIKYGTVITKLNYNEINQLLTHVIKNPEICPDIWKFYEYIHKEDGRAIKESLEQKFDENKIIENINLPFKLLLSSKNFRHKSYLFIYPNGIVKVPNFFSDGKSLVIGNLNLEKGVVDRSLLYADSTKILNNYTKTFIN